MSTGYPGAGGTFVPSGSYKVKKETFSEDSDEYVVLKNVPIFDEDDEYPPERLQEIVKVNNSRSRDTGDVCPIVVGHTSDDQKEIDKPPIVGFASDFKVEKIGKVNPRAAITATFSVLKDYVKRFPRKSVELWADGVIDPIALLGHSRPAKDLSPITFNKKSGKTTKYSYNVFASTGDEMDKEELVGLVNTTLEESSIGQYVKKLMDEPEDEETVKASEDEVSEGVSKEAASEEAVKTEEAPNESPSTGSVEDSEEKPEEKPEKKSEDEEESDERTKLQKHALINALDYAKNEVSKYQAAMFEAQKDATFARREADLARLNQEFTFNLVDELDYVRDLGAEQYAKHLQIIRTRYSKYPVNKVNVETVRMDDGGAEPNMTPEKVMEIVRFAADNKLSYLDAKKKLSLGDK